MKSLFLIQKLEIKGSQLVDDEFREILSFYDPLIFLHLSIWRIAIESIAPKWFWSLNNENYQWKNYLPNSEFYLILFCNFLQLTRLSFSGWNYHHIIIQKVTEPEEFIVPLLWDLKFSPRKISLASRKMTCPQNNGSHSAREDALW